MRLRNAVALAVSAAALSAAAAAAPAAAQTAPAAADPALRTSFACYGSGESVMLSGSGFTPQGRVALSAGGQQLTTLDADTDGGFSIRVQAPGGLFGTMRLRFTAADRARPALSAGATVRIADTDVVVTPEVGGPSRLRRIRAWGFFDVGAVYAHLKRNGARRARNIRLGRPRGACGVLDVRRRLLARGARAGVYTLQFDALRRYVPGIHPSVSYLMAVFSPALARTSNWPTTPIATLERRPL